MDAEMMDPYERKLYELFNSCCAGKYSGNNVELDSSGVLRLCKQLQLDDKQSSQLISSLPRKQGIGFGQFKEALLRVLQQIFNNGNLKHPSNGKNIEVPSVLYEDINNEETTHAPYQFTWFDEHNIQLMPSLYIGRCSSMKIPNMVATLNPDRLGYFIPDILTRTRTLETNKPTCVSRSIFDLSVALKEKYSAQPMKNTTLRLFDYYRTVADSLDANTTPTVRALVSFYQQQIKRLSAQNEHVRMERDKLRVDLAAASKRAESVAQEMDDYRTIMDANARQTIVELERKYSQQISALTGQLADEKRINATLEIRINEFVDREAKYKSDLTTIEAKYRELKMEHDTQVGKLAEETKVKIQLEKELRVSNAMLDDLSELESKNKRSENTVATLEENVNYLQKELARLRDANDELTSLLESASMEIGKKCDCAHQNRDSDCAQYDSVGIDSLFTSEKYAPELNDTVYFDADSFSSDNNNASNPSGHSSISVIGCYPTSEDKEISLNAEIAENDQFGVSYGKANAENIEKETLSSFELNDVRNEITKLIEKNQRCEEENACLKDKVKEMDAVISERDHLRHRLEECELTELELFERLEEERMLYQEERKQSDEMLASLRDNIEKFASENAQDKLPTIYEEVNFEEQVEDLQFELNLATSEINLLKKELADRNDYNMDMSFLSEEVAQMKNERMELEAKLNLALREVQTLKTEMLGMESLKTNLENAREEIERLKAERKNFRRRRCVNRSKRNREQAWHQSHLEMQKIIEYQRNQLVNSDLMIKNLYCENARIMAKRFHGNSPPRSL